MDTSVVCTSSPQGRNPVQFHVRRSSSYLHHLQRCAHNGRTKNSESDSDVPIFLLATGRRSGSTLLQRILITEPHLPLWGEPLGEMTVFPRLVEMLTGSISSRNIQLSRD